MKKKGYSYEEIGRALNRAPSAVWNEVKRNKTKRIYHPKKAGHKAYVRRKYAKYQRMRIVEDQTLQNFVKKHLLSGQSPEDIAGRLKNNHEKGLSVVSKDSIYRYIKSVYGRSIEARIKRKKRRKRKRTPSGTLDGRTFIDKRPVYINTRTRIGDAEADFILSGRDGNGILLVVVDRKLRIVFLEPLYKVSIKAVHRKCLKIKKKYPEWKTMSTDNDLLFKKHKQLEKELGVNIYFCHPYHSWEKGTIENTNGEIRKFFPKGGDVSKRSRYFFKKIEKTINNRFMKCLNYQTPSEASKKSREKKKSRRNRGGE